MLDYTVPETIAGAAHARDVAMQIAQLSAYRPELSLHDGSYLWSGGKSVDVFDSVHPDGCRASTVGINDVTRSERR